MEQVLGYTDSTGYTSAGRVVGGDRLGTCQRCGRLVFETRWLSHRAAHKRVNVVHAARMDMNARGVDFQPDQRWVAPQNGRKRRKAASRGR